MKKRAFFLSCITGFLIGSETPSDTSFMATVIAYKPKGFRRLQSGSISTMSDVVILQIREPKDFRDKELKIVLNDKKADFWNKVGRSILFRASYSEIEEAVRPNSFIILFEAAIRSARTDHDNSQK